MNTIQNELFFNQLITENTFVLICFSGQNCSVCQAVKPKIEKLVVENFSKVILIEIKTEQQPELAASLSVFTVPVILFFVEGREYIRMVRIIDFSVLKEKMETILGLYDG